MLIGEDGAVVFSLVRLAGGIRPPAKSGPPAAGTGGGRAVVGTDSRGPPAKSGPAAREPPRSRPRTQRSALAAQFGGRNYLMEAHFDLRFRVNTVNNPGVEHARLVLQRFAVVGDELVFGGVVQ